ncbi:hypothetical protein BJ165DRAFT_364361 [Panaeolus papilionaceus]|nr:hypothetical protein BJ165DRAFT_364361 [Panaeolus papilionaceus]
MDKYAHRCKCRASCALSFSIAQPVAHQAPATAAASTRFVPALQCINAAMEDKSNSLVETKSTKLWALMKETWASLDTFQHSYPKLVSPVPDLHLSNDPPSDEEEMLIRQAFEDAERRKQEIRDEMERRATQVSPPELLHIDRFICGLQGILSPVRRLPPEILQAIFIVGSEGPDMRTPFYKIRRDFEKSRATGAVYWPWAVSQVCRRWRQVCLETPTLWNYLPVLHLTPLPYSTAKKWENRALLSMIERSQGAPLNVFIDTSLSCASVHPIFNLLIKESHRWEDAILKLTWLTYWNRFDPILNRLQQLRSLRLCFGDEDVRSDPIIWDIFANAPRLQHIDLELYFSDLPFLPLSASIVPALNTFINNPNLQSLYLNTSLNASLPSSIILPHLKRLTLGTMSFSSRPIALDALILPTLEELAIQMDLGLDIESSTSVMTLVVRSVAASIDAFPLKKLYLRTSTASFLTPLMDLLPNLHTLEFPLTELTEAFTHRLTSTNPAAVVCPNLEFCTFRVGEIKTPELYDVVYRVAKARCCESLLNGQSYIRVPFKRLKALSLRCDSADRLQEHQRILEEFSLSHGRVDSLRVAPSTLGNLVEKFDYLATLPTQIGFQLDVNSTRMPSRKHAMDILDALRECNVDDVDVRDIYIPHFHLHLQNLIEWIELNDQKVKWDGAPVILKELQSALRDTLERFYAAFEGHTSKIHWVAVSPFILMHVPLDHSFRSSSESINLARVHNMTSNLSPFYDLYCEGTSMDDL